MPTTQSINVDAIREQEATRILDHIAHFLAPYVPRDTMNDFLREIGYPDYNKKHEWDDGLDWDDQ